MMNLTHGTFKNSIYNLAAFIWPLILFALLTPYMISKLGKIEYGIWIIVNSILGTAGILNFGIGDATIKYISEFRSHESWDQVKKLVNTLSFLSLAFLMIVAFILIFITPLFPIFFKVDEEYKRQFIFLAYLMYLGFSLNILTINALSVLKAFERYDLSSKIIIMITTLKMSSIFIALYFNLGLLGMGYFYIFAMLVALIITLGMISSYMKFINWLPKYDKESIQMVFEFNFYSIFLAMLNSGWQAVGNFLVGRFCGIGNVVYFSVPFQLSSFLHNIGGNISAPLFPLFSSLSSKSTLKQIQRVFTFSNRATIYIVTCAALLIFLYSREILQLWMGNNFSNDMNINLRLLLIGVIFSSLGIVSYQALKGMGNIKTITLIQLASVVVSGVLLIILLPKIGVIGAGYAYLSGSIVLSFYLLILGKKIFFENMIAHIWKMYITPLIGIIPLICFNALFAISVISNVTALIFHILLLSIILFFCVFGVDYYLFKEEALILKIKSALWNV